MINEICENYHKAGQIAAYARDEGIKRIKSGVSILDVTCFIESCIKNKGAFPAFPVNIAINDIAAHFTPKDDDKKIFHKGDVVKLDVGAHIDGYIADTAITIEVESSSYETLINASEKALENAIYMIRPGTSISAIGGIVQNTISSHGFRPIENLTGHSLNRFTLHAGLSIPNVASTGKFGKLKVGDVIAVEPFSTNGSGRVISGNGSNIYLVKSGMHLPHIRDRRAKFYMAKIKELFHLLPFAYRWCKSNFDNTDILLQRLCHYGLLHHYPQLIEQNRGIVTQKEHTLIITPNGCEVTTYGKKEG